MSEQRKVERREKSVYSRTTAISLAMVLFIALSAMAGTTGKIAGRVTDETGTPLVGATVMIEGTSYGAMTDANGEYFIINLQPGSYNVVCQMVGMGKQTKSGVTVIADQTNRIDFQLRPEAVGEITIEVTADETEIMMDVTEQLHVVSREDIETMPVSGITDIVSRQAGITDQNGTIHVRGGRSGEVVYMVDGMSVMNPTGNFRAVNLPVSSIQETSVITGGFGAEYGNAQSGIVNIVTREGGDRYDFSYRVYANDFPKLGLAEDWHWSDDGPFREALMDMTTSVGGPEPLFSYLFPAMGMDIPGDVRMMLSGSWIEWGGGPDERYGDQVNDGGETFRTNVKITYRPSPRTKLNLGWQYEDYEDGWSHWSVAWPFARFEEEYVTEQGDTVGQGVEYGLPTRFKNVDVYSLGFTQTLSDATFMETKFQYMHETFDYKVRDLDGGWVGEENTFDDWLNYTPDRIQDSDGYYRYGASRYAWYERETRVGQGRIDVTSQITNEHQIKAGIEGHYYDLFEYRVDTASGGNIYIDRWHAFPNMGAAYIQDKMEYRGMIVNAGLRFDYIDPNYGRYPADLSDPVNPGTSWGDPDHIKNPIDVSMKYHLSPRVGFSHPITDRDVLHFTYGHFFQTPSMDQLFQGADYNLSGAFPIVANPDLEPEETISYEMGVKHQFNDITMLSVAGFYKDITGLVDMQKVYYSPVDNYDLFVNGDYGNVRGAELSIIRRPSNFWAVNANYTYQVAQGKSSSAYQNYTYNWAGWVIPKQESYLDWDQRHEISANVDFRIPRGEGPRVGDYPILEGFGINVDWTFGSGYPFTKDSQGTLSPVINGERLPWTSTTELKVNKRFWTGPVTLNLMCWITNLFNRRNIDHLADAGWYLADQDGDGEPDYDPTGSMDNPYVYSLERQIRFGLGIEW